MQVEVSFILRISFLLIDGGRGRDFIRACGFYGRGSGCNFELPLE